MSFLDFAVLWACFIFYTVVIGEPSFRSRLFNRKKTGFYFNPKIVARVHARIKLCRDSDSRPGFGNFYILESRDRKHKKIFVQGSV